MEQKNLRKDIFTILGMTISFILLLVVVMFLDRDTHILQGIVAGWLK